MTWYNSSWRYRQKITIDHTKVDANLSDFPVLITEANIDSKIFDHAKDAGADIRITQSDGVTELPREIELFDKVNHKMAIWVKSDLSSISDTILYIYYGNAEASEPARDSTYGLENVWDDNFVLVQHLHEKSGTHYDSTQYHNNGIPNGGVTQDAQGQINGADEFDGADDYVEVSNSPSLNITDAITIEAWVKPDDVTGFIGLINRNQYGNDWLIDIVNSRMRFVIDQNWSTDDDRYSTAGSITVGQWQYWVITWQGLIKQLIFYKNGNQDMTYTTASNAIPLHEDSLVIGKRKELKFFNGLIDEVRISNIVRSPEYISTLYNNLKNPDTFYSVGSEEASGQPIHLRRRGRILSFGGIR